MRCWISEPRIFERRDFRSRRAAGRHGRERAQLAHLQRLDLQVEVGDLRGEGGIVGQGRAVGRLAARDVAQAAHAALGGRHLGDAQPLVGEQELGAGPALAFLADAVLDRHPHVIEEHVVHVMRAVEHDDRPHRDAGRLHVDQQEGDALLRLGLGVGAHQAEDPVAPVGERGPGLLAVDDVVVAPLIIGTHRPGAQAGEVGAGARLGIALAPRHGRLADARAGSVPSARRCRRCRSPARPS